MVSYCTALNVHTGVLFYPRHLLPRIEKLRIRHSPIRVYETTIDLDRDIAGILQEIDALKDRLCEWSNPFLAESQEAHPESGS